jgi:hypothetical protein
MNKENKSDKFKRLAKTRGDLVVRYLRLLGNLSNKNNYEYSDEEIRKVFAVIEAELKHSKIKFSNNKKREIKF